MNEEEEFKKIIIEYAGITKKHGLYSYEASDFIRQYENDQKIYDYLRFSRQVVRKIKEIFGEDLGSIEDKVLYYEDSKELGLEDNI